MLLPHEARLFPGLFRPPTVVRDRMGFPPQSDPSVNLLVASRFYDYSLRGTPVFLFECADQALQQPAHIFSQT